MVGFISDRVPESGTCLESGPWYTLVLLDCGLGRVCIGCLQIVQPASALSMLTGCLALDKHFFFRTTLIPTLLSLSLVS